MDFQELQYPFEIKKTEIATGEVIAHTDMGDGEPVVFIHGLGSYIPAWSKNLDELSEQFRCIALDLPGYGKSSKELHPGTMEYYSEVVVNLTAELGIEKFSVCGHSMGGTIALKLALLHPEKINKMVLIAPGGAEIYTEEEKHAVQNYLSRGNILTTTTSRLHKMF
jgi:Predicted hydrolases or acyltransferases (alpha/beta hydrolase superfamily)